MKRIKKPPATIVAGRLRKPYVLQEPLSYKSLTSYKRLTSYKSCVSTERFAPVMGHRVVLLRHREVPALQMDPVILPARLHRVTGFVPSPAMAVLEHHDGLIGSRCRRGCETERQYAYCKYKSPLFLLPCTELPSSDRRNAILRQAVTACGA